MIRLVALSALAVFSLGVFAATCNRHSQNHPRRPAVTFSCSSLPKGCLALCRLLRGSALFLHRITRQRHTVPTNLPVLLNCRPSGGISLTVINVQDIFRLDKQSSDLSKLVLKIASVQQPRFIPREAKASAVRRNPRQRLLRVDSLRFR